jgi:hypothetical protein
MKTLVVFFDPSGNILASGSNYGFIPRVGETVTFGSKGMQILYVTHVTYVIESEYIQIGIKTSAFNPTDF